MDNEQHQELRKRRNRILIRTLFAVIIVAVVLYALLTYLKVIPDSVIANAIAAAVFGIVIVETIARIVYYYFINNDIHKAEAKTLGQIIKILGYSVLAIIVLYIIFGYQYLGGIFVSAGFLGIILGLAAQSTISNFIAGIYLLSSNVLEPNDNVIIHTWQYTYQPQSYPHDKYVPGLSGAVESIGVLYTKMINDEGIPVYIPNNIVAQALIINYHRAKEHMRKIQFDVDVSVPFQRLEKIIEDTLKREGIGIFLIKLEYLHQNFYVVTINLKVQEKDIKLIKSVLFREIIKEINASKAKSA